MKKEVLRDLLVDVLSCELSEAEELSTNKAGLLIQLDDGDLWQLRLECLKGEEAEEEDEDGDDEEDEDGDEDAG